MEEQNSNAWHQNADVSQTGQLQSQDANVLGESVAVKEINYHKRCIGWTIFPILYSTVAVISGVIPEKSCFGSCSKGWLYDTLFILPKLYFPPLILLPIFAIVCSIIAIIYSLTKGTRHSDKAGMRIVFILLSFVWVLRFALYWFHIM